MPNVAFVICSQVQELESELDAEQRRHAETQKNARRADRRLKELSFQVKKSYNNTEASLEIDRGEISIVLAPYIIKF